MISPIIDKPAPNFDELVGVLKGEQKPQRVHLAELSMDEEVMQAITENYLDQKWIPATQQPNEAYYQQLTNYYYRMGFDYVPVPIWHDWDNHPPTGWAGATDTAGELTRGERKWANEGHGMITSWETFEQFPWDKIQANPMHCELAARHLPPGMKIVAETTHFEHVLEVLLGYEGLFYMLYDEPELVAEVFRRWGQKVYEYYETIVDMDEVGAIFHGDDLGFKTSTFVSPEILRQHVFPWFKKYAALAHEHGKTYWYHCCGNIYDNGVIEDLIEDVKVDAFHSFQDIILPVGEFKARYGTRIATLGGVDIDPLTRMDEASLRHYARDILGKCVDNGRYAFGTGNSVTNFIPLKNYFAILDEARCWQIS
jgi:uroporphyrinogen decarboxylase